MKQAITTYIDYFGQSPRNNENQTPSSLRAVTTPSLRAVTPSSLRAAGEAIQKNNTKL